ncbi:MAG: VOC family protein [Acidobacteriota bacterium]
MTDRPKAIAITPLFIVSDLQRAIDFYGKLGFQEPGVWGDPPCFAMVHRNDAELMLSLGEPRPNGNGVWDMYLRVADVGAEMAALKDAGVPIDRGPTSTEYDMKEIEVVDPDGFRICFGQDVT